MKFFNVLTKQQFNNGEELVVLWHKVGIIKMTKNGAMFLQMFHQPQTDYYIFEPKEKESDALPDIQLEDNEE